MSRNGGLGSAPATTWPSPSTVPSRWPRTWSASIPSDPADRISFRPGQGDIAQSVGSEADLYESRSLARVLGMRRTLWVVPTDTVTQIHNSSTVKIAGAELRRLARMVEAAGLSDDGAAWYRRVSQKTIKAIRAGGQPMAAVELTKAVPELREQFIFSSIGRLDHRPVRSLDAGPLRAGQRRQGRTSPASWQLGIRAVSMGNG